MAGAPAFFKRGLVAVALIAAAGAGLWFGWIRDAVYTFYAETYFHDSVNGLEEGSDVTFRGVKIGKVKRISFVGTEYPHSGLEDRYTVWVQLAFDRRLFRSHNDKAEDALYDMYAKGVCTSISADGTAGRVRIEMDYPEGAVKKKKLSWKPGTICIPPASGTLHSTDDPAYRILRQIGRMDLVDTWTNLTSAIKTVKSAMSMTDTILESQAGNINDILDNLREASVSLRLFAEEVRSDPAAFLRKDQQSLAE